LYGEVRGGEPAYTISVDVLDSNSNDKITTLEETAESREEIPTAIGRLAQAVRVEVSKDDSSAVRRSVSLEQEGTASLNALHAFAMGEDAMQSGRIEDALAEYQTAVSLDAKFVQAQMRLAWLYRSERAEVAAAHAAELARAAAVHSSEKVKLLAQFCYEMNSRGDDEEAVELIRRYVAKYPRDVDGMKGLARVLQMQGHLAESLQNAQQGIGEDPFDAEMYAEVEGAMVVMGHYEDALQLDAKAQRLGVSHSGVALMADFLNGDKDIVTKRVNALQARFGGWAAVEDRQISYADMESYGLYLDETGRMEAGLEVWRTAATRSGEIPELASTQAYLLAQGALDRALTEDCTVALEMVDEVHSLPKGPVASFNAGMAAALCGDQTYAEEIVVELRRDFPQNTAVEQYYVQELQAAEEIGGNEPAKALPELIALGQYDSISLVPYLRGMARAAVGQTPLAIDDFQDILARRGAAFSLGGTLYSMAEMRVARAYASSGDRVDSVAAYQRALAMWEEPDEQEPLMMEASSRSR
jgi:serine/threonine-protein kinase